MNKLTKGFAAIFALALLLVAGALVTGCKSTSEPVADQEVDSRAAADITAASLGTESGGAGVNFADVNALANGKELSGIIPNKSGPMSANASYNDTTGMHTVTVDRSGSAGKYSFSTTILYQYIYFDASGKFMKTFQSGVTDSIWVSFSKQRSRDAGDRVDVDDTASGTWTVSKLTSTQPLFNGTFSRSGTDTFHTLENGDRTFTHAFTITFINDSLVTDKDDRKHVYLQGPATSHFTATTPKGYTITRDTKIEFNGDGTAFLDVTRTSGDGTVDSYTIDVKVGVWKWKGKLRIK
ncbi:MAG: hypothetical protein Q8916_02990 [Bacteroidota bacterium]|nr:hypothetical protein [Bacteroidota bacterium]MDP4229353.1 hypothetical protein [Bacteroidota bacterium]MDP4237775.1 hypothetical protein [Bacteroidota bacterium]